MSPRPFRTVLVPSAALGAALLVTASHPSARAAELSPTRSHPAAVAETAAASDLAAGPALPEDASALDLESLRGQVVLLDFWASWCVPCVKSFPWLSSLQTRRRADGLVVIGVNVDKDRAEADAFLRKHSPAFPVVFDPEGKLAEAYDLQGMPCSFLIGRDGTRRFDHVGFRESDTGKLEKEIDTLLAEKGSPEGRS